ncbi:MAG: HlyD family efflux transporter periplasmic adaptor subunit [Sulfurovum sp.]|nr:HlyD family efflux transporter periplasmic adaptor subunit [Sulfurovum sp.]
MKKLLLLLSIFTLGIQATEIVLSPKQQANWQIEVAIPQQASQLPLGEYLIEVRTPASLLHALSLPFEAHVKKLYVANYQSVKKGDILAEVTGTKWIEIQEKAIEDIIAYRQQKQLTQRKNILCKEEIIPKKECTLANSILLSREIKVSASKALLQSYGAKAEMISKLFKKLTLSPTLSLASQFDGRIIKLNTNTGQSTQPSDTLFLIQKEGALWLESALDVQKTHTLHEGQSVRITLQDLSFDATVMQLSPVINSQTQTRDVRFSLPLSDVIFAGLRTNAVLTLPQKSLKIPKKAVIKIDNKQIVFIQSQRGYNSHEIHIIAEDENDYFVEMSSTLSHAIAVSSLAILKNILGEQDE